MHYARQPMRRRALAVIFIAGAAVPLLAAALFLVGCCVLPFHQTVHQVVPLCHIAAAGMLGGEPGDDTTTPAREKDEPVKRFATSLPRAFRVAEASDVAPVPPAPRSAYRTFIAHGALRCDQDIGLHVLVQTFLI